MKSWIPLTLLFALVACTKAHEPPSVTLQNCFGQNLKIEGTSHLSANKDHTFLVIKKSALNREFLLEAARIAQDSSPTSQNLQGRIIEFKKVLDRIYLLEATSGHVITHDLPATRILAEFPILSEGINPANSEEELTIDFNRGMRLIFSASGFYTSDREGRAYVSQSPYRSLTDIVISSYIQSITLKNQYLEIRQIAQIADSTKNGAFRPYEFRYYLSPYEPHSDFHPKETSDFRHVGFFEVPPLLEEKTGKSLTYIQKWDHSKPIRFSITPNTPAEYIKPIQEGILYWNRAFGREVIQVEMAPPGVHAPDPTYHLIQWVEDQSAPMSYADTLADPRTGEIRHAQIYLSSSFAINSRRGAAALFRRLKQTAQQTPIEKSLTPSFLKPIFLCDPHFNSHESALFQNELQTILTLGADDATFLRVSQDYIRVSVAHEIGHTLGLRHNFTASLGSTYHRLEKEKALSNYFSLGIAPPNGLFATSVMDYLPLSDDILLSAQISTQNAALPYDQLAINWAYENKEINESTAPLFCSDVQNETHRDCRRFDRGPFPLISNTEEIESMLQTLPIRAIQTYSDALNSDQSRGRPKIHQIQIGPSELGIELIKNSIINQLSWLKTSETRSIIAESTVPFIGEIFKQEIQNNRITEINRELQLIGSLERALFQGLPSEEKPDLNIARDALLSLQALLKLPENRAIALAGDQRYNLTESDVEIILKHSAKAFTLIENQIIITYLDQLKEGGKLAEGLPLSEIQKRLTSAFKAIVLTKIPTETIGSTYRYPKEMRTKAAQLLSENMGEELTLLEDER